MIHLQFGISSIVSGKAVHCPARWKLQAFDAVTGTVHLKQSIQKKVNAFQLRGNRRLPGLDSTYVNRANPKGSYVLI